MSRIERAVTRGLLRLPGSWLLRLAGGEPTVVEGRTLEPALQLAAARGKQSPHPASLTPAQARRATNAGLALLGGRIRPGVSLEPLSLPGPGGEIPARVYRPAAAGEQLPLVLFFHQGGLVIGTLDWCDGFCSILSDTLKGLVVAVDYRLAPEHHFPAATEDALAAWTWARDHAREIGGDPERIVVAGDSAGGNLAAVVAQTARREGGRQPVFQLLVYPWLLGRARTRSYEAFADAWPVDRPLMDWFTSHALEKPDDLEDPRLNPLREPDLSGLPPAHVATAGFDPLCDEGKAYADRLAEAGVSVSYRCYESLSHSFLAMGAVPACERAQDEIAEVVAAALQRT